MNTADRAIDFVKGHAAQTWWALWAVGVGALAIKLQDKILLVINSPKSPTQITVLTAAGCLATLLVLLGSTIWLALLAWRQSAALCELRAHKCPEPPGPRSYRGPDVFVDGAIWPTCLTYSGDVASDRIEISDPECSSCRARIVSAGFMGIECPNGHYLSSARTQYDEFCSRGRAKIMGMRARGELVFKGEPNPPKRPKKKK